MQSEERPRSRHSTKYCKLNSRIVARRVIKHTRLRASQGRVGSTPVCSLMMVTSFKEVEVVPTLVAKEVLRRAALPTTTYNKVRLLVIDGLQAKRREESRKTDQ